MDSACLLSGGYRSLSMVGGVPSLAKLPAPVRVGVGFIGGTGSATTLPPAMGEDPARVLRTRCKSAILR